MEITGEKKFKAAVITVSDKAACGEREDTSGRSLCAILEGDGYEVVDYRIVPDEIDQIQSAILFCLDEKHPDLVLTTGGTGFAKRDVTPEATKALIERETIGICEAMRAASREITPNGCLSRGVAGIRGETLIVNLPGSKKAAEENYTAVAAAFRHGIQMIQSVGSAECARSSGECNNASVPSLDAWLKEAKQDPSAKKCGMFLCHNGIVRQTAKAQVREGADAAPVTGMEISYDGEKLAQLVKETQARAGIEYVRVWLNEGRRNVGDDIMLVLVGGDIRPHVAEALEFLVTRLKQDCVTERELFD